jgi:hypothetical protein
MALNLSPYFSGIIFPIAITVRGFLEEAAGKIE